VKQFLFAVCMALVVPFASADSKSPGIHVTVSNIKEAKGKMAWALFAAKDGFPNKRENSVQHGFWDIEGSTSAAEGGEILKAIYLIENVADGEYALSVYQDLDLNQKMKSNWLGIPKEPVGVSLNPKVRMGPPRYDDSKFDFKGSISLDIKLHH